MQAVQRPRVRKMIKRTCVVFLLAVVCAASVLGTGFALWSFDAQSSGTQNLGVRVTQSTVLGTFSVPEINYVVLDGGTGAGINPTITGVSFYKSDEKSLAATDNSFTVSTVDEAYRESIGEGDNWDKVEFGIRINVPAGLEGLITHTDFYNERMGDGGYIDLKALTVELTDHFSDPDFSKSDFNYDKAGGVFTFALTTTTLNRFFTYLPSKEPDTLAKFESLGHNFAPDFVIELWQGYAATA